MQPRTIVCLLLLGVNSTAQTPAVVVPAPAQRYLDILIKRPQPGTIFERFYAAWLEESSTTELGAFLEARTKLPAATAADQLLFAVFHSHRGDDRAALTAYEAALKLDPANTSAWIERSRLEARALDFATALQSLDEAVKAKPDAAGTMEIGKLRGHALLRLGKNEEALRTWKELAAAHADDEDLSEELIDLLTDEGQYEAALERAQALIKRSLDPVARTLRQLRLTDILLLAERRDEALKTLRETLAATGADSWVEGDVLSRISRVFRMSDDVAGFEKFMAALVKEHPQRVALAWQHTLLLGETGQKDSALKEARALLQSNPGRRDLQEGFLDLLESLDLIKEAVEQAVTLTQQNAADKEMLVRLASLQHRAKEDAAAQSTLERFLKLPGAGEADHLRVARLLENWEDAPAKPGSPAALAYLRLVETFPASISAQEAQAHYLHRTGQRDAALAIWTRLAKSATLEDLLRITQALQARQESRTALDLLAPREQDFAQEPRFYSLLVQLGIANKEVERALPWARTRLRLAQDAEGIESAVKDLLLVLRSDEPGKLSSPLQQELQNQTTLTIQNRCLLAALLENAGKNADAEKTLNSAPAEDKMVALSHLAILFQTRQEWEKAAQTLQQVIALPGARTTARVQRMVDFYRRAEKPEQALTWIAEWKKLSPSAVQPWLDESRLLIALNRTKDALALLRGTLRKFPDSVEAASSYATLCLENGQPDEAERTYLALYEKTTDATARLRLIGPLALAAQQHNSLPRLIENFQQRQKQNRASAQPWLALAEIHRTTNNDEERRRCLYEASRLRPQDLALLLDIARSEEEIGLTAESLRTLESAAKLDKTSKTRENIARLQIDSGDADLGYRILFEIAGGSQMDARALEQMADTIAEKGEWERVIAFLEPVLEKHPKDYRLHYLNAVALEEAGREKEAVRAFIEIMSMHEELPGVLSTGRSIGLRQQYGSVSLPPGTEDWLVLPTMVQAAYVHRQKQGGRANYGNYNTFGNTSANGLPSNGFIQQAPGVTESPVLALAHVLQIVSMWDVAERDPALRSLMQAGVSDAPLLLTAAENSPQLVITPEMLADQPQNAALHAAWLMQNHSGDPAELLPICESAFKLFQTSHPMLALRTAAVAWNSAADQSPVWVRRILDICQALPKGEVEEMQTLTRLLRSQSETFQRRSQNIDAVKLSPEDVRDISAILKRWEHEADDQQSYYFSEVIFAFAAVKDWNGVVEIIQHRLSLPDKPQSNSPVVTPSMMTGRSRGYYRNFQPSPMPVPATSLKLPADALNWLSNLIARQEPEESAHSEEQKKWIKDIHDGLQPFMEKTQEPKLKLILRLMTGEQQAMLDDLMPRLSTNPSLDDLLFAGWLSQQLNQSEKALAYFQQAQALTTDAAQISQLDFAMLYQAQRLLQQSDNVEVNTLLPKVKPVLEHLSQTASTQDEKYMLSEILNSFGMQEEAEKMEQAAQGITHRSHSQNTQVISNPYSRSYSYRQQQQRQVSPDELLKKGDEAGAVQEILKRLHTAIQGCLNPQNSSNAHHQIHEVIKLFTQYKLTDQVMLTMQTAAGAGWKPQQEYAVLLEHTGLETKPAIEAHRAVITANPRAFASHARLATLLAMEGDFQTALHHWKLMPEVTQAMYLPALIHEFSERSSIAIPRPAALAGFLSTWLRSLPANRPQPASLTQHFFQALNSIQQGDSGQNLSFPALWEPYTKESHRNARNWVFNADGTLKLSPESQKARDERRAAHDELCQAMLQIPELALMGFAPLGGLAMFENLHLAETENIALDLLSLRAMPKVKRRLMAQGNYQQYYGGFGPVSTLGGLFATSERIAMPVPAVFATYSAALRGDQHLLDEVIFPAILKAEGKTIEEYCRTYAALLMSDDAHFVSAATAWLKPQGKSNYSQLSQQQGGPLDEIVQLWQTRKITEPLNQLLLLQSSAQPAYSNFGYLPQAVNSYAFALGQRDPEALRSFVRTLRDQSIGATPEMRSQNIARWRDSQRQRNARFSSQSSRSQQAVQGYIQWLQNLLQDRRGLGLVDLAMEDGLDQSPDWLRQIASHHAESGRIHTPEEFLFSASAVGFLGDASHFRAYDLSEAQQHNTWLGNLCRQWRERSNDERLNSTLDLLGKRKPSFGADLMQALLLKNSRTVLHLDGTPTPLETAQIAHFQSRNDGDGFAYRSAALQVVLTRHAQEIATMSTVSQSELSLLLRDELRGYPRPDQLGKKLAQVLAPLLKAENTGLVHKIEQVIATKTWNDIKQQEYQFTQQFPALLRAMVDIDITKADAAARHAVELLRGSPEQKQAVMQNNRETPVLRLLTALTQVPQLLHTTFALADQEGVSLSRNWNASLRNYLEESLHDPENIRFVFSGTPWVAEAAEFRDPKSESSQEPTLLSSLINRIENSNELRPAVHDFLAKQPAAFGTELLLAFLHRDPGDDTNRRSFYNSKRPDDSSILAFIQKRRDDFARLQPASAASLLAMLNARMPDLDQKSEQDAALKQSLQPLITATSVQFEADIARWMQMTSLSSSGSEVYEAVQFGVPLLDRLAQSDKPRAIALLDQISKLVAQQDALNSRGGGRQQPHQTQVAKWLQNAAAVPELFREVMQRAEECGAARDSAWLERTLGSARNLYKHRGKPQRVIALLEAAGMLEPAATFNPRLLPSNTQHLTMLEVMSGEFTGGSMHPDLVEELNKRQPRTFGVDLITLLCSKTYNAPDEITAFAQAHAEEIAACSAEQKNMLGGIVQRKKWVEIFAANVPALQEAFAPLVKEQQAKLQAFIENLLKIRTWRELELIYIKSLPPAEQSRFNLRMPGGLQNYSTGERSYLDYFADQLQQMVPTDIHKVEQALQLIGSLYLTEFSQSPIRNRMPPLNSFVLKLCSSPRLAPKALQFGAQHLGSQNPVRPIGPGSMPLSEHQLISIALPEATVASAEKLVRSLDEMGLLADAATYDAFSLPGYRMRSVLALTLSRLSSSSPDQLEKTAQFLLSQKGAKFGHYLFAACLTNKDSPERSRRLELCSSHFPRLNPQAAGAVLDAFEKQFPELGNPKQAEGDLARFAPLLQLRTTEERSFLDALLAGKPGATLPFRGYSIPARNELVRLLESARSEEAIKLVLALSRHLEPQDPSTSFARSPFFRDGGMVSHYFQNQLRANAEDSPALLACQMLAAASLPEIRVLADKRVIQTSVPTPGELFLLWEQRGGWAAPKAVWADFMRQTARYDIGNTRGLWLPLLHQSLEQMGPQVRREVAMWAAEENSPGLQIIRHECRLALELIESTEAVPGWPEGPRKLLVASPSATKKFAASTRQSMALLQDEQIKPHVRLSLAAWLTLTHPGLMDEQARQTWGLAAAKAWHDGVPITRFELELLLNSAAVQPVNEAWKQTSRLALERWEQLEAIIRKNGVRQIDPGLNCAILRLSTSSTNSAALEPLVNTLGKYDVTGSAGILLEKGAWQLINKLNLRTTQSEFTYSDKRNWWQPPSDATLREMQAASLEDALLAEVIALAADDTATRILYPASQGQPLHERFTAFAKKVAAIPLPQQPFQRAQTLAFLGLQQPEAALLLLPQYDAIAKVFMSDSLGENYFNERIWVDFIAVHAALKTAKGDFNAPNAHAERMRTDPGMLKRHGTISDSTLGYFRSALFQCLSHFWSAGTAREPEKLLQLAILSSKSGNSSENGYLSQAAIQTSIRAWRAVLKKEPLPAQMAEEPTGVSSTMKYLEFIASIVGTGKHRLPFQQRLELIARVSAPIRQEVMAGGSPQMRLIISTPNFWSLLLQLNIFTFDELVKNTDALLKISGSLAPVTLESLAHLMRENGSCDMAARFYDLAKDQWYRSNNSSSSFYVKHCLLHRAEMLIRCGDFKEARLCLDQHKEIAGFQSEIAIRTTLLNLISPPPPAPAK